MYGEHDEAVVADTLHGARQRLALRCALPRLTRAIPADEGDGGVDGGDGGGATVLLGSG